MATTGDIARLNITLDDVEPEVLRRVDAPLALPLDRLHLVLQVAMPWQNYHLYEFRAGKSAWGLPSPDFDWGGPRVESVKNATLADLAHASRAKSFKYLYDFGDGWEHTVKIERVAPAEPDKTYPLLIEATGRCPPEDVGGPPGYAALLDAMSDPNDPDHEDAVDALGENFDPSVVDGTRLRAAMEKLAKRWSRPPVQPRRAKAK